MKLEHITFTGIDFATPLDALLEIQRKHPIVEFGVLISYKWAENGNRYLRPSIIRGLRDKGLNLSLHVCGSAAHDAAVGNWNKIDDFLFGSLDIFKRCQLNIAERKDNPRYCQLPRVTGQEIIIQQRNVNELDVLKETLKNYPLPVEQFSVLLDASGGRGIDTPIEVLKAQIKVGYAGGFNADNVAEKLSYLLKQDSDGGFWIDMESGVRTRVRTHDWFDVEKVNEVLEICDTVIQNQNYKT